MAINANEFQARIQEDDVYTAADTKVELAAQYDPKKLTEPGTDHTQDNDIIIAAYQDVSFKPETQARDFMHIGTGGHSMWERHWHKIALPDAPEYIGKEAYDMEKKGWEQEGPSRAMTFTEELASQYSGADQHRMQAHNHSETGRRQNERFNESLMYNLTTKDEDDESAVEPMSHQEATKFINDMREREEKAMANTKIGQYVERHPDSWETRYETISEFCKDAFELGTHMTFIGILKGDEETLATGRRIMEHASNKPNQLLDDDGQTNDLIKSNGPDKMAMQWPDPGISPEILAEHRLSAMAETIREFFTDPKELSDEAVRFLAHTFVSHDRLAAEDQTSSYLHDLGAKNGGTPSALRRISDNIFERPDHHITEQAVEAICSYDPAETRDTYHKMGATQTAIVAAAYVSDSRASLLENDNLPTFTDHNLDDLRKEIEELAEEYTTSDRSDQHRAAEDLKKMTEPGYLEKCVAAAQQSQQWKPFINNEIEFRPYG